MFLSFLSFCIIKCIFLAGLLHIAHLFQTRVKILPVPWKDLIQQAKTAAGDWVGWTSPAFWSAFLPLFTVSCSHSTLTAETSPSSVALSACQSEQSGDRGSGRRGSRRGSRPGGRSFRRRSQSWEPGSSRGGLSCSGRWPRCWSAFKPHAPVYPLSRGYLASPPQKFWPKKKIKGATAERGVETWTTDMTSLQLLGAWGDILRGIC